MPRRGLTVSSVNAPLVRAILLQRSAFPVDKALLRRTNGEHAGWPGECRGLDMCRGQGTERIRRRADLLPARHMG